MNTYSLNQIVKGINAGYFVILAFPVIAGEQCVALKEVNPANFAETAPGGITLPINCIKPVH